MNVHETLQILTALKSCGASHFKSDDFEVHMSPQASAEPVIPIAKSPAAELAQPQSPPSQENKEATEKLQTLIKTMQLSPEELLDVVMPAGAGG